MPPPHLAYFAIKNGRDGSTICTSWEEVNVASSEATDSEFCSTDTRTADHCGRSKFRWGSGLDSVWDLIRVSSL